LLDELASYGDPDVGDSDVSSTPEAYDAVFSTPAVRQRILNYTHIFRQTVDVSDTQRAVNTAGIDDEYQYQISKRLKELAREMEFGLIHSQLNSQSEVGNVGGTPATARKMEGILAYIEPDPAGVTSNYLSSDQEGTITECGSPIARLTETVLNDHFQTAWEKGIRFKTIYAPAPQKREISGFITNATTSFSTRNIDAAERRAINTINVYESDFGTVAVVLHRMMPTRQCLTMDEDYSRIAVLRPILVVELSRAGNSTRCMIEGEITYECLAPSSLGKLIWGSNVYGRTA
jgi:hypothetical protein